MVKKCKLCEKKYPDLFTFLIPKYDIRNVDYKIKKILLPCFTKGQMWICETCYKKIFIEDSLIDLSYAKVGF